MTNRLDLGFDVQFEDLYCREGLVRLDGRFDAFLQSHNRDLHDRLTSARAAPDAVPSKAESELMIDLAPELEDFIAELFGIRRDVRDLQSRHNALAPLYSVKRLFVQRRAAKKYNPQQAATFDGALTALDVATFARRLWLERSRSASVVAAT